MASLGATAAAPPASGPASGPAVPALARIQSTGQVRVCIWPDYYSISLRDLRTQQLAGIDIDLAQALARDLGASVQFVDSSFARLVPDVLEDRCDVAMFAIGIIPQRHRAIASK